MVKIAAISYLNTLPFVYGLEHHSIKDEIELQLNTPSQGAIDILNKKADIGIIPVVSMLQMPNLQIVSDYCIGAVNSVASVLLCSNVPLQQLDTIYLDTESMTSVMLTRVLSKKFWNIAPAFKRIDYSLFSWEEISGDDCSLHCANRLANEGYVIIGDKAMANAHRFDFVYDLADEWIRFSGLPFVFASWISGTHLPDNFISKFNQALEYGINNIDLAVEQADKIINKKDAVKYLKENISYPLTPEKRLAMETFLKLAKEVVYD